MLLIVSKTDKINLNKRVNYVLYVMHLLIIKVFSTTLEVYKYLLWKVWFKLVLVKFKTIYEDCNVKVEILMEKMLSNNFSFLITVFILMIMGSNCVEQREENKGESKT